MKCPFQISWELVSPEIAKIWLENHNTRNRPLKKASADAFARDMAANRWCPNHQGVAFSKEDGALIDGQNRLTAIVISGRAQWMMVCREVPERVEGVEATVMETIDRGTPRSVADMLRLGHGMTNEANLIAAACLQVARLCVPFPDIQAKKASVPQTVGVLKVYAAEMKWLAEARSSKLGIRAVALAGTMAFARAVLPKETAEFFEEVKNGEGKAQSPAMLLREAILEERLGLHGNSLWDRCRAGAVILRALKAYANALKLERLPRPEECTPVVEWFREQQIDRVRQVRALFPMLRETTSKPWPPAPETKQALTKAVAPVAPAAGPAAPVITAKTYRPTEAALRLLKKAGAAA
jgi:hypothetical protein